MKTQFQKYLAVISACVILLSMAVPAFATEPTAAEEAIDYDKQICATWYIDLSGRSLDAYVYPDTTFTWSGSMEAISTGTPSQITVYNTPDPIDSSNACLLDFRNNWGLSIGSASCGVAPGSDGPIPFGNISCTVTKIRIVSPDPVSANNEKLYKWFKANGFFSATIPNQGGSSGDPATEDVSSLDYSFWQLNETISLPADVPTTYSAVFSLPYVDPDTYKSKISFDAHSMKIENTFAYSFDNKAWINDKYRYLYFELNPSAAGLLRWLKDNGRLIDQVSTTTEKPTVIDDLYGQTWVFNNTFVEPNSKLDVTVDHVTDVYPNGNSKYNRIWYETTGYSSYIKRVHGAGSAGQLYYGKTNVTPKFYAKWIRFREHCTDPLLIEWIMQNATLSEWPAETIEIPPYVPPEQGGVLGSGGVSVGGSGGSDQSGWITGGGLVGTQPLPGLNAGFLSWLAGTMDGIMNVNLFGFFSIADILSFCLTISIILILLKFFGG